MTDQNATSRLGVTKTHKLYIGGKFVRSESGRSLPFGDGAAATHLCRASRKDLRAAVEAAHGALAGWSGASAYLRGQILYRVAEMMEGRRTEYVEALTQATGSGEPQVEVDAAIDRLVAFAGWTDKFAQVLGCHNPVSGPYYNFTTPEPIGVVGVIAPDDAPLLGLVSLVAPAIAAGNTVVALAADSNPLIACLVSEVCATGDVPGGVVNILTGRRGELVEQFATHREIGGVQAANTTAEHRAMLESGAGENIKRVLVRDVADWHSPGCESPWWIEPLVEMKTIWHPSSA